MSDFLFDTPYWVFAVIVLVAAALLLQGNTRQDAKLKRAGIGMLLMGVLLVLLNFLVTTDKKTCIKRTRLLAAAVQNRDKQVLLDDLSQNVSLGAWGRDDIVNGYAKEEDHFGVKEIKITSLEATQDQTDVTITLGIMAHLDESSSYPDIPSTWRLDWQQSADGWHVARIRLVSIGIGPGTIDGAQIESQLFGQRPDQRRGDGE